MPKVAYDCGAVDKQVSLQNIPQAIFNYLKGSE
jgi:chemotaxis response regulator CheB